MYVVLENYQGMVCDYPEAYEDQPGFEFLCEVPVTWDETKVLHAVPGQYICIARRKGDDWYIGAITNKQARMITADLKFLPSGSFTAEIYSDAGDTDINPDHLQKKKITASRNSKIPLDLAAAGGAVIHLKKLP